MTGEPAPPRHINLRPGNSDRSARQGRLSATSLIKPGRSPVPRHRLPSLHFNHKKEFLHTLSHKDKGPGADVRIHRDRLTAEEPTPGVYSLRASLLKCTLRAKCGKVRVGLTVDLQHDGGLLGVTAGVGHLAAVDAGVLDDGVVNDEPGPGRLGVQRHPPGGHDALALRVVPLQPHRLAKSCVWGGNDRWESAGGR